MTESLLALRGVQAVYGKSIALQDVSLQVGRGEIVSLMGRNGMGKTSTLNTIVGVLQKTAGTVHLDGVDISDLESDEISRLGIALVPADRGIFALLSVEENLKIARRRHSAWTLESAFASFPRLKERRKNLGGALSGGEQQMLSIARALLQGPKVLLLDEPTEGLAPVIVDELVELIADVGRSGVSIVLVEQTFAVCRALASRHYILEEGQVVFEGPTSALDDDPSILERLLGLDVGSHA